MGSGVLERVGTGYPDEGHRSVLGRSKRLAAGSAYVAVARVTRIVAGQSHPGSWYAHTADILAFDAAARLRREGRHCEAQLAEVEDPLRNQEHASRKVDQDDFAVTLDSADHPTERVCVTLQQ